MGKRKVKWNSERILSITAMCMSFITLIIFVYQTNLMSKQNALSILPYLQVSTSDNWEGHSYILSLRNHGVGPAIIESVILEYQEKQYNLKDYNNELYTVLTKLAPELDSIRGYDNSTLDKGIALPANSNYVVFGVKKNREDYNILTENLNYLEQQGLRYEIIYKSIQDERWIIHNDSEGPEKLD